MIKALLVDGNGKHAKFNELGQLSVAAFDYDDPQFRELAEDDTAYNFFGAKPGKQFIITGIFAKADKQVSSVADADVVVYESSAPDSTTVDKVLFQIAMVSGDIAPLIGLNIKVTEAVFVNAKTSDDDIHMTIMGHYVPASSV